MRALNLSKVLIREGQAQGRTGCTTGMVRPAIYRYNKKACFLA